MKSVYCKTALQGFPLLLGQQNRRNIGNKACLQGMKA